MNIIICPKCHSKFKLDIDLKEDKRIKMRCSVCSEVFVFPPEENPSYDQEFEDLIKSQEQDFQDITDDDAIIEEFGKEISETTEEEGLEEAEADKDSDIEPDSVIKEIDSILGAGADVGHEDQKGTSENKKKKSKTVFILLFLIIIALLAFTGMWLAKEKLPFLNKPVTEDLTPPEMGPFFTLPQDSVTYEILNNYKEGPVLVLKGVIKKLSQRPLDSVMLQARVYDSLNNLMDTRNTYAGIIPDKNEFTKQKSSDLQTLLTAMPREMGILSTSKDIPFTVAFFGNPAREGKYFQIEVKEFHWK